MPPYFFLFQMIFSIDFRDFITTFQISLIIIFAIAAFISPLLPLRHFHDIAAADYIFERRRLF
jgi:hypothetical protein